MSKIKMQHYVPQFYLKNFSNIKKNNYYMYYFDKKEEETKFVNIHNIGGETYFYDTQFDTNQIIEKTLGKLESKFNISYQKLVKSENLGRLIDKEKEWISLFIGIQLSRTRVFRDMLESQRTQMQQFFQNEELTPEFEEKIKTLDDPEFVKKIQIRLMMDMPKEFVPILMKMKWVLVVNKTDSPFWTSDHPITMSNPLDSGPWSGLGIKSRGIQIHFPLTSSLMLFLGDPQEYNYSFDKMSIDDKENVINENWLQVLWSRRHLFSNMDNFELAKKMLEKNTDLKDPNRQRVTLQTLDKTFSEYYPDGKSTENPFDKFRLWES